MPVSSLIWAQSKRKIINVPISYAINFLDGVRNKGKALLYHTREKKHAWREMDAIVQALFTNDC